MKPTCLALALALGMLFSVGCDRQGSQPPVPKSPAPESTPTAETVATVPVETMEAPVVLPLVVCKSRLWGKVMSTANGQATANVAIELASGGRTFKTTTDKNGLYSFVGLCAGQYAMTIALPGGKAVQNPNKITVDGVAEIKVDLPYK